MIKSSETKNEYMKRIILILSIIFSLLSVLFMASPLILRMTGLDHSVKTYLFSQIMDTEKGSIDIDNYRIGLGTMELNDVVLQTSDHRVNLFIPAVVFDFYFHDIFIHPANPQIAVKSITFKKPVLILNSIPGKQNTKIKKMDKLFNDLKKIKGINQIRVEQGKIIYKADSKNSFTVAKNIVGQITPGDSAQIKMVLEGSILSSQSTNCRITTMFHTAVRRSVTNLDFLDVQADELHLPFLSRETRLEAGVLTGSVKIENKNFLADSTRFDGNIKIAGLKVRIKQIQISDGTGEIRLNGKTLKIKNGSGRLNGSDFKFDLLSENLLEKKVKANIRFTHLALNKLTAGALQSRINDFNIRVRYDFSEKKAYARVTAKNMFAGKGVDFTALSAQLSFSQGKLQIGAFGSTLGRVKIRSHGIWNSEDGNLNLSLLASLKSEKHVFFDLLTNKTQRFGV